MEHLFFRESNLLGSDIELYFHKDYPYLYNEEEFPVVKFTVKNCQNAQSFDFGWLLGDNDGAAIEITQENNHSLLKISESADESLEMSCENILREEIRYRESDLYYLISELLKQQERENETTTNVLRNLAQLQGYFEKELEIINRKLKEADWLSIEKQQFLEGQKTILEKSMDIIGFQ